MIVKLLNPTGGLVRGTDKYGSGAFGASRSRDGTEYSHKGVDITCTVGQAVVAPCNGVVTTIALAYAGDDRYHSIHIQPDADLVADLKLLYVKPARTGLPYTVYAGQELGTSEDLNSRYPGITQHVHCELHIGGVLIDPTPLIFPPGAAGDDTA